MRRYNKEALPGERAATANLAFAQSLLGQAGYDPIKDAKLFHWARPELWERLRASKAKIICLIISKCAAVGPNISIFPPQNISYECLCAIHSVYKP